MQLRSRQQSTCDCRVLFIFLASLVHACHAKLSRKWWTLGPFASGKTEYDGDPLAPFGGVRRVFENAMDKGKSRDSKRFLAEHAAGGYLEWRAVETAQDGRNAVQLPYDHIPAQQLMQRPPKGASNDVLHVQYWAVGSIKVQTAGRYALDCRNLHTFQLAPAGLNSSDIKAPLAGNIFSLSSPLGAAVVDLQAKTYRLFARVRGKLPLNFACSLSSVPASGRMLHAEVQTKKLPDVVRGRLLVQESAVDLRVKNLGSDWLDVRAVVDASREVQGESKWCRIAPGGLNQLPVVILMQAAATIDKEESACVIFTVNIVTKVGEVATSVSVRLRCRKSTQSALMSFIDVDGSVATAAVLPPKRRSDSPLPILVSMSGVGAEPQGQVDAYKLKPPGKESEDFVFGYDNIWILAPERSGPHNWEDVGMRTALEAIEVFANAVAPQADRNRLIVHGHSRGGHGAWGLATRIPDRVLGVASVCGWYSREEYGDANNLWVHETSLMHLDKMLLGIMHASIGPNEDSLHASNLVGMSSLVRVGTKDNSVSPWFGRRMARHLKEVGAELTFQELDKEHWWWDSVTTNDGGVMHDETMRKWTLNVSHRSIVSLNTILDSSSQGASLVSSGPEHMGRFGVRILQLRSPATRGTVRIKRAGTRGIQVRTSNVIRIQIRADAELRRLLVDEGKTLAVDGSQDVQLDAGNAAELCAMEPSLAQESASCASYTAEGKPATCIAASGGLVARAVGSRSSPRLWHSCRESMGAPPLSRPPSLQGPIRRIFSSPWIVVVPDEPSVLELQLANYFATGHFVAVNTATQIASVSLAATFRATHRFVWLGRPQCFPAEYRDNLWPIAFDNMGPCGGSEPDDTLWSDLHISSCQFGLDHGAVFLAPGASHAKADVLPASELLDLVVTATSAAALRDIVTYSFASNVPHTRAPMSNMLPDFMVTGPDFAWQGYGGIVAAGFWDSWWQVSEQAAYLSC